MWFLSVVLLVCIFFNGKSSPDGKLVISFLAKDDVDYREGIRLIQSNTNDIYSLHFKRPPIMKGGSDSKQENIDSPNPVISPVNIIIPVDLQYTGLGMLRSFVPSTSWNCSSAEFKEVQRSIGEKFFASKPEGTHWKRIWEMLSSFYVSRNWTLNLTQANFQCQAHELLDQSQQILCDEFVYWSKVVEVRNLHLKISEPQSSNIKFQELKAYVLKLFENDTSRENLDDQLRNYLTSNFPILNDPELKAYIFNVFFLYHYFEAFTKSKLEALAVLWEDMLVVMQTMTKGDEFLSKHTDSIDDLSNVESEKLADIALAYKGFLIEFGSMTRRRPDLKCSQTHSCLFDPQWEGSQTEEFKALSIQLKYLDDLNKVSLTSEIHLTGNEVRQHPINPNGETGRRDIESADIPLAANTMQTEKVATAKSMHQKFRKAMMKLKSIPYVKVQSLFPTFLEVFILLLNLIVLVVLFCVYKQGVADLQWRASVLSRR